METVDQTRFLATPQGKTYTLYRWSASGYWSFYDPDTHQYLEPNHVSEDAARAWFLKTFQPDVYGDW